MRRAYVIGANGPEDSIPLRFARNDAEKIARVLQKPRCGYEVVSAQPEWSASNIRENLFELAEVCAKEDTFVCYFSGHGSITDTKGELALLLDSTIPHKLLTTTIFISDLIKAMNFCEAQNKILILDCCHAGALVNQLGLKSGNELPVTEIGIPADNVLVLMASGKLERTRELEHLQGSFMTSAICSALDENFDFADLDGDGAISVEELKAWLNRHANQHNTAFPDLPVPYPEIFGKQKGKLILTRNPLEDWKPVEIDWPDGIIMVPMPVAPFTNSRNIMYAACISKYPITNSQYRVFMEVSGAREPHGKHIDLSKGRDSARWEGPFFPMQEQGFKHPEQPVVCVSYEDASHYCTWINEHYPSTLRAYGLARLPSPEFWDYAAYGKTSFFARTGNLFNQSRQIHHKSRSPAILDLSGNRTNSRGVSDMFGNVWEWCSPVTRRESTLVSISLVELWPVIKGGSFLDDLARSKTTVPSIELPEESDTRHSDIGFRIACRIRFSYLPKENRYLLENFEYPDIRFYASGGHYIE